MKLGKNNVTICFFWFWFWSVSCKTPIVGMPTTWLVCATTFCLWEQFLELVDWWCRHWLFTQGIPLWNSSCEKWVLHSITCICKDIKFLRNMYNIFLHLGYIWATWATIWDHLGYPRYIWVIGIYLNQPIWVSCVPSVQNPKGTIWASLDGVKRVPILQC